MELFYMVQKQEYEQEYEFSSFKLLKKELCKLLSASDDASSMGKHA